MDSASAKLLITRKRAKLENLLKATVNHEPKRTLTAAKTRGRTGAIELKANVWTRFKSIRRCNDARGGYRWQLSMRPFVPPLITLRARLLHELNQTDSPA